MTIPIISPVNAEKAVNIYSHKLTKASLDAPMNEVKEKIGSTFAEANYFPFDSSVGKVKDAVKKLVSYEPESVDFFSETAPSHEIAKV